MPNDTSMPDVEAARDSLRRTLRGTEGPFDERLAALESAIAERAQARQIERLVELEARGVPSPDLLAAIDYLRAALKEAR